MSNDPVNPLRGGCLCGQVGFRVEGELDGFYLCHCSRCRKDTGSAHSCSLSAHTAVVEWEQGADQVKQYQVPDTLHTRNFCQTCGSALPAYIEQMDVWVIPAGSVEGDITIPVSAHINYASKANWEVGFDLAPKFDAFP